MKALENLIPLKSKVTVYVPATTNVDKAIDNSEQVARMARLMSECFGGATATQAQGFWISQENKLVVENTTMVFAYCTTEQAEESMKDIIHQCYIIKHQLGQEAVALEYNGAMYFV